MKKHCVVLSGPTVAKDKTLIKGLEETFLVLKNDDNDHIETLLRSRVVDLVLMEVSASNLSDIELIRNMKAIWRDLAIILVDATGRKLIAKAFEFGVKDVFKKPYKADLLAERSKSVIAALSENSVKVSPVENR